jgi:hypothetical protein
VHLNLKDDETVALVSEVARRLGMTKTGAVRELARQRLAELDRSDTAVADDRERSAFDWLEREVWPRTVGTKPMSQLEQDKLLGFDDAAR